MSESERKCARCHGPDTHELDSANGDYGGMNPDDVVVEARPSTVGGRGAEGVYVCHIPSGHHATVTDRGSAHKNRTEAMRRLRVLVGPVPQPAPVTHEEARDNLENMGRYTDGGYIPACDEFRDILRRYIDERHAAEDAIRAEARDLRERLRQARMDASHAHCELGTLRADVARLRAAALSPEAEKALAEWLALDAEERGRLLENLSAHTWAKMTTVDVVRNLLRALAAAPSAEPKEG